MIVAAAIVGRFVNFRSAAIPSPVPPTINVFSATPNEVTTGGEAKLQWEVVNAVDVQLEPFGQVPLTGIRVVQPQQTTIYRLTATSRSGGKSGTFQEVIVNKSDSTIQTAPPPPNFAGTWDPIECTINGVPAPLGKVTRLTITQDGNLVHLQEKGAPGELAITSDGTLTYKLFHANDKGNVATESEADLVDTFTWSLEGPILVVKATFDYKHQYASHAPGTELAIWKFRRVASDERRPSG